MKQSADINGNLIESEQSDIQDQHQNNDESSVSVVSEYIYILNNEELPSFDSLPNEIIALMLFYLPLDDLKNISMVNKRLFALLQDPALVTSWIRYQANIPLVKIALSSGMELPFPPPWLLRPAVRGKKISYLPPLITALPLPPLVDGQVVIGNCNKLLLLLDYFSAAEDFWQKLTQAQLALLTLYEDNPDSWISKLSFKDTDTLLLLLVHQFPYWRIQDRQKGEEIIIKRQAFIKSLIDIGFLPDYSKKEVREKWAEKNLILFPFSPEQNGVEWHQAMQWLYQQENLTEIRLLLSEAVTTHCKLLLKQGDDEHWASAYLAVKYMTVSMSEPYEFPYAIDYLTMSIQWLHALMSSPLFVNYASRIGQLVFEILVCFNNSKWFQPNIFRDYRHSHWVDVSYTAAVVLEINRFIRRNRLPEEQSHIVSPNNNLLKKVMEQGQTLFKSLKPHVTLNSHIKKQMEEEEKFEAVIASGIELF